MDKDPGTSALQTIKQRIMPSMQLSPVGKKK